MTVINTIQQDNTVTITFEMGSDPYVLKDAIVLTQEEYDNITLEQVDQIQLQRYENWMSIVNSPQPVESLSPMEPPLE